MKRISVIRILKNGGIGILPTDTIYGLVGSVFSRKAVARIYKLRKRNPKKPMIVLISAMNDIQKFGIHLDSQTKIILNRFWPGKVSVILPCQSKKFSYLHRGAKTLAFRTPAKRSLIKLLRKTGPLVAPSANLEGNLPAKTIKEAEKYFGDKIDFYVNAGKIDSPPSTLIEIKNKKLILLRKGA